MRKFVLTLLLASLCVLSSCGKSSGNKITKAETMQYAYVASAERNIFHKPSCRWVKKISEQNLIGFTSRDDAIKSEKRPCKTCQP